MPKKKTHRGAAKRFKVSAGGKHPGRRRSMPKKKTHRGAAKRFKVSAGGKLLRRRSEKSHILTKKSTKRKRRLRKATTISPAFGKTVKKLLQ